MKFNFLRRTSVQTFRIRKLNGGINLSDEPYRVGDNQLTGGVNVWFENGTLKTRPGIAAKDTAIIRYAGLNPAGEIIFKGEKYRVLTALDSPLRVKIFFLSKQMVLEAGTLLFDKRPERIFFYSAGEAYAIAAFEDKSNVYIFCEDTGEWSIKAELAVKTENVISFGGTVFLTEGNRMFAAEDYAPHKFCELCSVGNREKITGFLEYKEKLIVFKESAVFIFDLVSRDPFQICEIGCNNPKTAVNCGGYPIWLSPNNEVCLFNGRVISVLCPLASELGKNKFAIDVNGCYLLISGQKAVIIDTAETGKLKCFCWDFGDIRLLCGLPGGNGIIAFYGDVCCAAVFEGYTDIIRLPDGKILKKKIKCGFSTKNFDFGISEKKQLENIFISVAAKGQIEVSINGRNTERINLGLPDIDNGCGTFKSVRIIPHMHAVRSVYITLKADDAFSLDEIMIYFRNAVLRG